MALSVDQTTDGAEDFCEATDIRGLANTEPAAHADGVQSIDILGGISAGEFDRCHLFFGRPTGDVAGEQVDTKILEAFARLFRFACFHSYFGALSAYVEVFAADFNFDSLGEQVAEVLADGSQGAGEGSRRCCREDFE